MLWKMDWLWPNKEKKWKLNSQHIKQPNASSHHTTTEFEPKPSANPPSPPFFVDAGESPATPPEAVKDILTGHGADGDPLDGGEGPVHAAAAETSPAYVAACAYGRHHLRATVLGAFDEAPKGMYTCVAQPDWRSLRFNPPRYHVLQAQETRVQGLLQLVQKQPGNN
jgi:hypothetical protein